MTSRHQLLEQLHVLLRPRGYLEIGTFTGESLTLSRTKTVAVDPVYQVSMPVNCDVKFITKTSDAFFSHPDPLRHLPHRIVDLAFIDGMHLIEFALRDFINIERHSHPGTVVVFDDVLPRNNDEAARNRHTGAWTGDVYKLVSVLQRYRPDLVCVPVDTTPTGTMVVVGLDRNNHTLSRAYETIVADCVSPDPQDVPDGVLNRNGALAPDHVLGAELWIWLRRHRTGLHTRRWAHQVIARRARAELLGGEGPARLALDTALTLANEARQSFRPRTRWRAWFGAD